VIKPKLYISQSKPFTPIVTFASIAWCVVVFISLNLSKNMPMTAAMKFGYFSESEIFSGRWYSLITSAFVHIEIMHVFFNMYWLFFLGPVLEKLMGSGKFLAFILVTAFISSGWQLATGHGGIGFSGVGYAIIGFGWLARDKFPEIRPYFNDRTLQIMAGWAVLCVFLTYFNIQNVANVAHIMGAAAGALIALSFIRKMWIAQIGLVLIAIAAIVPVYWNPRSPEWNFAKGSEALQKKDYKSALLKYRRSAELDPSTWETWYNIALIDVTLGDDKNLVDDLAMLRKLNPNEAENFMKILLGKPSSKPDSPKP